MITEDKFKWGIKVSPPTIFEDFRGDYVESYNEIIYNKAEINVNLFRRRLYVITWRFTGYTRRSETWN